MILFSLCGDFSVFIIPKNCPGNIKGKSVGVIPVGLMFRFVNCYVLLMYLRDERCYREFAKSANDRYPKFNRLS
jgi:hypothetical protein